MARSRASPSATPRAQQYPPPFSVSFTPPFALAPPSAGPPARRAMPPASPPPGRVAVHLNVYDLLHPEKPEAISTLNWYLYGLGMGLYHSGVSVFGTEYCFGGHAGDYTGVFEVTPRTAPEARFRESIVIGYTALDPIDVSLIINQMAEHWGGSSYNLLTRNCNHFASELCEKLTGAQAPAWINRLAWMGEKARFLLPEGIETPMAAPVQAPEVREAARAARGRRSPDPDDQ